MPYNYKTELERYRKYYHSLGPLFRQPKAETYTMVIFSFLTVSLFGWYAIRPTGQTILYLKREIRDKTEVSKKMDDKISSLIEAQARYEEATPYLPIVEEALPSIPDAVSLMIQLRNLADLSGAKLNSIQLSTVPLLGAQATSSAVKTNDQQKTFTFSVSIHGPYQALHAFIEGLKVMRRIVTFESISVDPIQSTQVGTESAQLSKQMLQLTIKVIAYYLTK